MEKVVYDRMERLDGEHWWFVARRRILSDQISALPLPPDARILEVGCGPGGNLAMLSRYGSVSAMEFNDDAREIAAKRSGIVIQGGALPDDLAFEPSSFDLVAALDVIEHIEDDSAAVKSLARLLKPSGSLIITVPAYRWLWSRHDDIHHHKRRYRRDGVRALVEGAGLSVVKLSHFNTVLFPLIVFLRLAEKLLGLSGRSDDEMPVPIVNRILGSLFSTERYILRHLSLPVGISILCIASYNQAGKNTW